MSREWRERERERRRHVPQDEWILNRRPLDRQEAESVFHLARQLIRFHVNTKFFNNT